ncbi:MAG: ROK family protein [Chitinivibrionales bacterium]|nr:ROK family protein [Chitinivibrionales bacterium]MBD3358382.1 ROK family protein [Chitinivibrionales bacterium]
MATKKGERYWVGFDLGGTKMMAVVYDERFAPVSRARKKTKASEGAGVVLQRIAKLIKQCLDKADVAPQAVAGIGIGCPGPLDLDAGVIISAPNLGFSNVGIKAMLEKEFKCPVILANDVDIGLYGEYVAGGAQGSRCAVGLFPGTGLGGGCVYEGMIIRGRKNSCFEIGHIQVLPDGPLCGCGRRGCLEAVSSRLAVSAAAALAGMRGEAPNLVDAAGMDLQNIRSGALGTAIEAGDTVVEKIVREAARWIGVGVATAVNLMLPDIVVLGGGMVEAMPELILEEVSRSARSRVMPGFRDQYEVVTAKLGDDAGVRGAAAWAQTTVKGAKR